MQNVPEKRAVRSIMEEVQRASFDSAVPLLDRRLDLGSFHNQPSPVHCVLFSVELFEPGHGLLRGRGGGSDPPNAVVSPPDNGCTCHRLWGP